MINWKCQVKFDQVIISLQTWNFLNIFPKFYVNQEVHYFQRFFPSKLEGKSFLSLFKIYFLYQLFLCTPVANFISFAFTFQHQSNYFGWRKLIANFFFLSSYILNPFVFVIKSQMHTLKSRQTWCLSKINVVKISFIKRI